MPAPLPWVSALQVEVSFAGGEANVAVDASQLGMDAAYVTRLPDQELGILSQSKSPGCAIATEDPALS